MTWSYSGDPGSGDKDHVRFLIQDTDETDQLFSDEEVNFLVSSEGGPLKAAFRGAQTLAAKFARCVDETVGKVKASFSQRYEQYAKLCEKLKRQSDIANALPFAGGLEITQKDIQERDSNRVVPSFTTDKHEFVRTRDETDGRVQTGGLQGDSGPP